jgi:hypothetical protein
LPFAACVEFAIFRFFFARNKSEPIGTVAILYNMLNRCILIFCFFYGAVALSFAQHPLIKFDASHVELGKVPENGGPVKCRFTFTNDGGGLLRIIDVKASCGCSTPLFSTESIAPGAIGYVDISFDPRGRPGPFLKSATIYTNGKQKEVVVTFSGEVVETTKKPEYNFEVKGVQMYNSRLDLGVLNRDISDTLYFTIKNKRKQPLIFKRIQQHSGGLWTAKLMDKEIAPGGSGVLMVVTQPNIKTSYKFFEDPLTLHFKSPGPKRLFLTVFGQIADDNK